MDLGHFVVRPARSSAVMGHVVRRQLSAASRLAWLRTFLGIFVDGQRGSWLAASSVASVGRMPTKQRTFRIVLSWQTQGLQSLAGPGAHCRYRDAVLCSLDRSQLRAISPAD